MKELEKVLADQLNLVWIKHAHEITLMPEGKDKELMVAKNDKLADAAIVLVEFSEVG